MENNDELCGGVKILIERMKSNPDEFTDMDSTLGQHKWGGVMSSSMWDKNVTCWDDVLTPAEVDALRKARSNIMRDKFTNLVMARLLKDQEETKTEAPYPSGGYFVSTGTGGGGSGLARQGFNPYQNIGIVTSNTSLHPLPTNPYQNSINAATAGAFVNITQPEPKSFWGGFFNGLVGR